MSTLVANASSALSMSSAKPAKTHEKFFETDFSILGCTRECGIAIVPVQNSWIGTGKMSGVDRAPLCALSPTRAGAGLVC